MFSFYIELHVLCSLCARSGNTMFLVLERPDAVLSWRQIMGPAADPNVDKESAPNRCNVSARNMFSCRL